jgi:hypothetical protein
MISIMASKKPNTKPLRFRVERIGDRFVIFDAETWTYTQCKPGTSRSQADLECAARNGAGRQKTSEAPELPSLREKLRREGSLSPEEYAALNRPRERDLKPVRLRRDQQILAEQIRKALPALCRAWGCILARQSGIDDAQRRSMTTDGIIAAVGLANRDITFNHHAIETLDACLRPIQWGRLEDEGFEGVIVVHYLSSEATRHKAAYLGRSERDYFRKLGEGHQWLTRCIAAEYDGGIDSDLWSQQSIELYNADPDYDPSDDDGDWYIDPDDLANFHW